MSENSLVPERANAEALLAQLQDVILDYYYNPGRIGDFRNIDTQAIRAYVQQFDFVQPADMAQLLASVAEKMKAWTVATTSPGYMGLFNPAVSFSSILAEAFAAVYNPQLAAWSHAPLATEMEQHCLHYFANALGMPMQNGYASFTSGGNEANHTAVLLALAHHFPHYVQEGLAALSMRPVLYITDQAHNSFDKIAKNVGLGMQALRYVPTDSDLRMDIGQLRNMIAADRSAGFSPFFVSATAGTTAAGIIDPLGLVQQVCAAEGVWFHVDAAWAGGIAVSAAHRQLLSGIEKADSVTVDAHKWLSVPYTAGMLFTPHRLVVDAAFGVQTKYMPPTPPEIVNYYQTSLQWSRRFTGLKLFFTLAEWGQAGLAELVARKFHLGDYLRSRLQAAGWQLVNSTPLPVICFTHPKITSGQRTLDDVLEAVYATQESWISITQLRPGERCLRACITNYKTTAAEVDQLLKSLVATLK